MVFFEKDSERNPTKYIPAMGLTIWFLIYFICNTTTFDIEDEHLDSGTPSITHSYEFLKPGKPPDTDLHQDPSKGCFCRQKVDLVVYCFGRNSCTNVPRLYVTTPSYSIINTRIRTIRPFDFEMAQNITALLIEGNIDLSEIGPNSFRYNTKLSNLSLSFNFALNHLYPDSFNGLINLETLTLFKNGFNKIYDITLALTAKIVPKLTKLNLNQNSFSNVLEDDFAPMIGSKLQILNLILCRLTYIHPDSFAPLKNLRLLGLGENNLNASTIANVIERSIELHLPLQLLDLCSAGFRSKLPKHLLEVIAKSNISILNLAKNHFEVISSESFPYMPNLVMLDLSGVLALELTDDAFVNLPNLKKLKLRKNRLYKIQKGLLLPRLKYLDMEDNSENGSPSSYFFISVEKFSNLSELQYLNLNNNPILHLDNSSFDGLNKLEKLFLKNTSLYAISHDTFTNMRNLTILNIEENPFIKFTHNKRIPCQLFAGLNKLQALYLGSCEIADMPSSCNPFADLESLKYLSLERNHILYISPSLLEPLKNLETLDLSFNLLTVWDKQILSNNLNLQKIMLTYNRLKYFTRAMLEDFCHVGDLELFNNPFNCNCELVSSFNDWILDKNVSRSTIDYLYSKAYCLTKTKYSLADYFRNIQDKIIDCDREEAFSIPIVVSLILLSLCLLIVACFFYYLKFVRRNM